MIAFAASLIAAAVLVAISTKHRLWGVAFVLLLLPTYLVRFELFGLLPMTMLEVLILTLFVVFLVQDRSSLRAPSRIEWWYVAVALLVIAGVFGMIVTPDLRAGAGIFKAYILEPILYFFVFIHTVKSKEDLRLCFWALGISAFVVALAAGAQYATGWGIPDPWHDLPDRRATAFYGYPNAVGLYIAPILTLFIGLLFHVKFFTKSNVLFVLSLILFLLFALIAARVEGAFIAVAAGTVVMALFSKWRWWAIALAVAGVAVGFLFEPVREILLFQDVSGDVRLALWEGTINLLKAQPVFGAGLAAFPMVYDIYRLPSHVELLLYPHNLFLNFWVELGVLGLAWIVSVLVLVAAKSVRAIKRSDGYTAVLLGVMACFLVYGLVDVPFFKNDLAVLFWTWLGVLVVSTRTTGSERALSQ
ncbi:MAG: O-antigen ligase family protein [Candidatus Kerfeldbacteria bacterium]